MNTKTLARLFRLAVAAVSLFGAAVQASEYSDRVLLDNPVGYWRLGESSGPTAADIAGSGPTNNGTYTGTLTLGVPGLIATDSNTAVNLGGAGYVNVPDASDLNFVSAAFTIEAWINPNDSTTSGRIVDKTQAGFANGYGFDFNMSGTPYIRMLGSQNLVKAYPFVAGNRYHVVAISSGSGTGTIYVNGAYVVSTTYSSTNAWTGSLRIGADSNGASNPNAIVDEVAVYNYALSASTIQQHYQIGLIPEPSIALLGVIGGLLLWSYRCRLRRA